MKSIILKSLETNSTTILPEFGSLMKMGKTIMFNEFLKFDDGKLTKLYASEKSISEVDAKVKIQEFISRIKSALESGKAFPIENLGAFVKKDGKIKFEISNTTVSKSSEPKPDATTLVTPSTTPSAPPTKTILASGAKGKTETKTQEPKKAEVKNTIPEVAVEKGKESEKIIPKEIVKPETSLKKEPAKEKGASENKVEAKKDEIKKAFEKVEETIKTKGVVPVVNTIKETVEKGEKLKENLLKATTSAPSESKKAATIITKEEKKTETKDTLKSKEKATTTPIIDKTKTEDIAAIAAISEGLETDKKKQKKGGFLLWAALLCILIAGGIFGYLKQDLIKGWFASSEVASHTTSKDDNEHSESADSKHNTEHQHTKNHEDTEEETMSSEFENEEGKEDEEKSAGEIETSNTNDAQTELDNTREKEEIIEEESPQEETPVKTTISGSTGAFHIVAGSYSTQENAQKKADKLKTKGYPDAAVLGKFGKLYKVKVSSYSTKEEAKIALKEFKSNGYSGMIKEY